MTDLFELPVWPAANLWPMLSSDDLDALRADIEQRGLVHPLVTYTDPDGQVWLLDGRNRRAAIDGSDVEPAAVEYTGDDPDGFVLSVNLQRRHATASQLAMVYASTATTSHGGDRKSTDREANLTLDQVGGTVGIARRNLVDARYLLEHRQYPAGGPDRDDE
jgi:hypothetical protein